MIPASYLFKDAFRQSFYDPDVAAAVDRHRSNRGTGLFSLLRRRHGQRSASPATETPDNPARDL